MAPARSEITRCYIFCTVFLMDYSHRQEAVALFLHSAFCQKISLCINFIEPSTLYQVRFITVVTIRTVLLLYCFFQNFSNLFLPERQNWWLLQFCIQNVSIICLIKNLCFVVSMNLDAFKLSLSFILLPFLYCNIEQLSQYEIQSFKGCVWFCYLIALLTNYSIISLLCL